MDLKEMFAERFKELRPNDRLLAIQLNGFSHKAYYDQGNADSPIEVLRYSTYSPEQKTENFNQDDAISLFKGKAPHYQYQNNPREIVYVNPEDR